MILAEGRNCWKVARADRASFVIDAGAYFAAFREAVSRARRSVMIIGWDVDSRVRLVPRAGELDTAPLELLPFLNHVLEHRPELRVFVLVWDFSVIYTLERELLPSYRFAWKGHPRLTFRGRRPSLGGFPSPEARDHRRPGGVRGRRRPDDPAGTPRSIARAPRPSRPDGRAVSAHARRR